MAELLGRIACALFSDTTEDWPAWNKTLIVPCIMQFSCNLMRTIIQPTVPRNVQFSTHLCSSSGS
jgi:hypothetical protein